MNIKNRTLAAICATAMVGVATVAPANAATAPRETTVTNCSTTESGTSTITYADVDRAIQSLSPEEQAEIRKLDTQLAALNPNGPRHVIPAAVVAAAALCAGGAVSGMVGGAASQALAKLINWNGEGAFPTGAETIGNAIVGCLTGGVGSYAWKLLPAPVKAKAVGAVVGIIMKVHRW